MHKLTKNVSIYSLGNILNRGAMFLLLPLYAHLLNPEDFGKLELVNTIGAVLVIMYGLMVETGYSRMYFQKNDKAWRASLFFTGQAFNLICSIVFGGLIFIFSRELSGQFLKFPEGEHFLKMITLISLVKVLTVIPFNNIRNRQKASLFVALNLGYLIANISLSVVFLLIMKTGVSGVLYSQLIAGIMELGALYYITRDENGLSINLNGLKAMLGFSIFLIPSNLSSFVLNFSNRYFLSEYQDLDQVGMYSLGAKIASVIPILFTEPVKKAFGPHIYSFVDNRVACSRMLADFTRVFFAGLAIVALTLSLFSREAVDLFASKQYTGSHDIVFILSSSYMLLGLAGVVVMGIHISLKTWIVTLIWPFSAILNIALNILLIPAYGRMGASIATLLSVLFITICYFIGVHYVYRVRFAYVRLLQVAFTMFICNYLGSLVSFGLIPSILMKLGIILFFVFVLIFTGYFTKDEVSRAINLTQGLARRIGYGKSRTTS